MRRRRHEGQRSARGYLESPKRPGRPERHPAWVLGLINARIPGGQRSFACISSRIATVIQVTVRAIKGTITDLMSHSQFHCTGRVYLDLHGLIFETSICYWQDQPGSPKVKPGRLRGRPPDPCLGRVGVVLDGPPGRRRSERRGTDAARTPPAEFRGSSCKASHWERPHP